MKKVKFLFFVSLLFVGMGLSAQTVDEIINKHIEAIGGKANLDQVKSLTFDMTMDVMGSSAPVTEYLLNGKGFKTEPNLMASRSLVLLQMLAVGQSIRLPASMIRKQCLMLSIKAEGIRSMLAGHCWIMLRKDIRWNWQEKMPAHIK